MNCNLKTLLIAALTCISLILPLCKTQTTTICQDNVIIVLTANTSINYITSYNFPNNYNYSSLGDCRILIKAPSSFRTRVIIEDYVTRTTENTLKVYDGASDTGKILFYEPNIETGKSKRSTKRSLYLTHWSYGTTNNAFRISYEAVEEPKKEEEQNLSWIAGPIVGGLVFIFFVCHCKNEHDKKKAAQTQPNQQVNNSDPVAVQQTSATAVASVVGPSGEGASAATSNNDKSKCTNQPTKEPEKKSPVEVSDKTTKYTVPLDVPPPYALSGDYTAYPTDQASSRWGGLQPPGPPSRIVQTNHGITALNDDPPSYTPYIPDIEQNRLSVNTDNEQFQYMSRTSQNDAMKY